MTDKVEDQAQQQPQPEAPGAEGGAELNIQDLNAMKVIIDIASSRGAFKPNEMAVVGNTYNKLTTFLDQVAKKSEGTK